MGALESSSSRALTGGGEEGKRSACPGKATGTAAEDAGSSGAGVAAGWWGGRDDGGHEV